MTQLLNLTGGVARHADLAFEVWFFALAVAAGACTAILGLVVYQFVGPETPEDEGDHRANEPAQQVASNPLPRATASPARSGTTAAGGASAVAPI